MKKECVGLNKEQVISIISKNSIVKSARLLDVTRGSLYNFIKQHTLHEFTMKKLKQNNLENNANQVIVMLEKFSLRKTATILNVSKTQLNYFKKKHGLRETKSRVKLEKAQVCAVLEKNTFIESAKTLGVSRWSLYRFMKKNNLTGWLHRSKLELIKDQVIHILKKNTIRNAAKILKVSETLLYNFKKKHGLIKSKSKSKLDITQVTAILEKNSIIKTAKILGVSLSSLQRFKKKHGLIGLSKKTNLKSIKTQIIATLKNNTVKDSARILNLPRSTLYGFIRQCAMQGNFLEKKMGRRLEKTDKDRVIILLEKNSVMECANILGVSISTLYNFIKRQGIPRRRKTSPVLDFFII